MKLRTSLQISALFPIVLAIVVSLSLFMRARETERMLDGLRAAEEAAQATTRLWEATHKALYLSDREAIAAWPALYVASTQALSTLKADDAASQGLIGRMHSRLSTAHAYFENSFRAGAQTPPDRQLMTVCTDVLAFGFELMTNIHSASKARQEMLDLIFMGFIGVVGLSMAANILMISRDVFGRVSSLTAAATAIARGDLDHAPVMDRAGDELGDLSTSLATMIERLKRSSGSLEKELDEHKRMAEEQKRIAQSVRDANMKLSDALVKIKTAQQQIVQQERLHALEQIARGVATTFDRTILPIVSTSELMLKYPETMAGNPEMLEQVKKIRESALLALRCVNDLSEFFRPPVPATQGVADLNAIVAGAIRLTEPSWDAGSRPVNQRVTVTTELGEVPAIPGDEASLRQALVGLILNAADALPSGGAITVSTRVDGPTVLVSVADNGLGMPEDVRRRCTEPFFTTKGAGATGMGLALANTTARRHGGTLDVDSQRGKGTRITLRLPIRKVATAVVEQPVQKLSSNLNVLIVDDEFSVRELVSRMLAEDGHKVRAASSGTEGLEEFKNGRFDLVVLDQAMPDMSGTDVALKLKELQPRVRILMLTGLSEFISPDGKLPPGIDHILAKPAEIDEFRRAMVRTMLG